MTARKPRDLRPYEEGAYDICDIFDTVAQNRGELVANVYVQRLLGQVVKDYPKAAEAALGKSKATLCLATYKAVQSVTSPDAPSQADDADVVEWPAELVDAVESALADYDEDMVVEAVLAALDVLGQPAPAAGGKATSSGDGSKAAQKSYDPTTDPYAIGVGADQVRFKAAAPIQGTAVAGANVRPTPNATDDTNVEAALREVGTATGPYRNENEYNRRVATQWLRALAQRLRDNLQLYGKGQ